MSLAMSSPALRRDMRAETISKKRVKEHNTKWAAGTRLAPGVHDPSWGYEPASIKMRPEKPQGPRAWEVKSHANLKPRNANNAGAAAGRIVRKADANFDSTNLNGLSRSLIDLLPAAANQPLHQPPPADEFTYSFDAKTSPRQAVGLDSLVERAERDFALRETERLVKTEWEVLDTSGESAVLNKKKGGKSPKQAPLARVVDEDEDDWERI